MSAKQAIFLLHGDDHYRLGQELSALKKRVMSELSTEACSINLGIKDDIQTVLFGVSLFAADKLVLVDLDEFNLDELIEVISADELPDFVKLIVYKFGKLDKRTKSYKAIEKLATRSIEVEAFSPWKEAEIVEWVRGQADLKGIKIENLAAQKLVEFYSNDTASISAELERLFAFTDGKTITFKDIEFVSQAHHNLFDLADDLMKCDYGKFSEKLKQLTYFQNPLPIVAGLQTVFRSLLQIKDLQEQNLSSNEIAKLTGKNGWKISQDLNKVKSLSVRQLALLVERLNQIEEEIKTGASFEASYHMRFRLLSLAT